MDNFINNMGFLGIIFVVSIVVGFAYRVGCILGNKLCKDEREVK